MIRESGNRFSEEIMREMSGQRAAKAALRQPAQLLAQRCAPMKKRCL
jgi:hypothetical protein